MTWESIVIMLAMGIAAVAVVVGGLVWVIVTGVPKDEITEEIEKWRDGK
jgi:hypothetical protein